MPHLRLNRKLERFVTTSKPIKVCIGGRGSGKSIGVGDIMSMKMDTEGADIYCLREYQDSIGDSVHRVFEDSINTRLKLEGWDVQEKKVIAPNGAVTRYKGASRNPDSIQSAQGYKYSWFEEAHRASKASLDKLLPTIIRNPGAECWFTANPQSAADPFSQRFIKPYLSELRRTGTYEDEIHLIQVVNWRDNPWWSSEQEALRQWDYENRPRAEYNWIWEGDFYDEVDNSIIPVEWFDAAIDAHVKKGFKGEGAIIAAHDPSDEGADAKGYALRHGSVVLDVAENPTGDSNEGMDWAIEKAIEAHADWFVWDCDGLGIGLKRQVDTALHGKHMDYFVFKGSEGVENPDHLFLDTDNPNNRNRKTNKDSLKNKRAQYYWRLRDKFYATYRAVVKGDYIDPDKMISLSSDIKCLDQLRAEVCRIPLKRNDNSKIQIMSKLEMSKKPYELPSPNLADSLMMLMVEFIYDAPVAHKPVTVTSAKGWD